MIPTQHLTRLAFVTLSALAGCAGAHASTIDTTSADGSGWCNNSVQSREGAIIHFDYLVETSHTGLDHVVHTSTARARVHVEGASFEGAEQVSATVIDYSYSPKTGERQLSTQAVTLTWDGAGFTGNVPEPLELWVYRDGEDMETVDRYVVNVLVNGNLLIDSTSGASNLGYPSSGQASDACLGTGS